MNPVENAVRHAYYLMNFFMAQAYLTMLAWCDMLLAAVTALKYLPRPQSRNLLLRGRSPHEIATVRFPRGVCRSPVKSSDRGRTTIVSPNSDAHAA